MRTMATALIAAAVLLAGCTEAQFQDIETDWEPADANEDLIVTFGNPDSIHVLRNINAHPNLAIICFEGVAVMTHTREAVPVRVSEWDTLCPDSDGQIRREPGAGIEPPTDEGDGD